MIYLIRHTISFCMQQYTDRKLSKHRLSFTLEAQKKMKLISKLHISKTKKIRYLIMAIKRIIIPSPGVPAQSGPTRSDVSRSDGAGCSNSKAFATFVLLFEGGPTVEHKLVHGKVGGWIWQNCNGSRIRKALFN